MWEALLHEKAPSTSQINPKVYLDVFLHPHIICFGRAACENFPGVIWWTFSSKAPPNRVKEWLRDRKFAESEPVFHFFLLTIILLSSPHLLSKQKLAPDSLISYPWCKKKKIPTTHPLQFCCIPSKNIRLLHLKKNLA